MGKNQAPLTQQTHHWTHEQVNHFQHATRLQRNVCWMIPSNAIEKWNRVDSFFSKYLLKVDDSGQNDR